jgi:alpha-N-arabinofuranosidase
MNLDPSTGHRLVSTLPGGGKVERARVMTADTVDAHNTFDAPDRVHPSSFTDYKVVDGALHVELPPLSVLVLELSN